MTMKKENSGEIVMYQPDETIRLEVRMGEDSVWLTQQQIALLFGVKQPAISKHLINIFKSGELHEASVHSILEYTATDDEVYHIGASIKDLGKKWFAFTLMHDITPSMLAEHLSEKGGFTPPYTTI